MAVVASARTAVKDPGPLRGAPLVSRSASLTASSLRLLSFQGGSGRSPFLGCARFGFYEFPVVLEVMRPGKNRSASSVARNFGPWRERRPWSVTWERILIRSERSAFGE